MGLAHLSVVLGHLRQSSPLISLSSSVKGIVVLIVWPHWKWMGLMDGLMGYVWSIQSKRIMIFAMRVRPLVVLVGMALMGLGKCACVGASIPHQIVIQVRQFSRLWFSFNIKLHMLSITNTNCVLKLEFLNLNLDFKSIDLKSHDFKSINFKYHFKSKNFKMVDLSNSNP